MRLAVTVCSNSTLLELGLPKYCDGPRKVVLMAEHLEQCQKLMPSQTDRTVKVSVGADAASNARRTGTVRTSTKARLTNVVISFTITG